MTTESVQMERLNGVKDRRKDEAEAQPSSEPSKRHFKLTDTDRKALREALPIALFVCLLLFSVGTYIAYLQNPSKSNDDVLDLASYAFPSLAAVAAGLNISLRREALWFWVSAIFVFAGLIVYILKNGMLGRSTSQFIYFIGIVAIITMAVAASMLQDGPWKSKSWVNPVFGCLTIILATVQCTLVLTIERKPPMAAVQEIKTEMQCHKISGGLQNVLILSCMKKR